MTWLRFPLILPKKDRCTTKDIGNRLTKNIGNTSPTGIARVSEGKRRQGRVMRRQQTQRDGTKVNEPAMLSWGL